MILNLNQNKIFIIYIFLHSESDFFLAFIKQMSHWFQKIVNNNSCET